MIYVKIEADLKELPTCCDKCHYMVVDVMNPACYVWKCSLTEEFLQNDIGVYFTNIKYGIGNNCPLTEED